MYFGNHLRLFTTFTSYNTDATTLVLLAETIRNTHRLVLLTPCWVQYPVRVIGRPLSLYFTECQQDESSKVFQMRKKGNAPLEFIHNRETGLVHLINHPSRTPASFLFLFCCCTALLMPSWLGSNKL